VPLCRTPSGPNDFADDRFHILNPFHLRLIRTRRLRWSTGMVFGRCGDGNRRSWCLPFVSPSSSMPQLGFSSSNITYSHHEQKSKIKSKIIKYAVYYCFQFLCNWLLFQSYSSAASRPKENLWK